MGSTNQPRPDAADTGPGQETPLDENRRTGPQKQHDAEDAGVVGPAPGRPKNAPPRIPGQLRDPDEADDVERNGDRDDAGKERNGSVEQPSEDDSRSR